MDRSNPSPEAMAETVKRYLASVGGWRADLMAQPTMTRPVGVNRSTWSRWLPTDPSGSPAVAQAVADGTEKAVGALLVGGKGGHGDHHIRRDDLVSLAHKSDSDAGRVALFTAVMMWGSGTTNGRGPRYTAVALADPRLLACLRDTAELV